MHERTLVRDRVECNGDDDWEVVTVEEILLNLDVGIGTHIGGTKRQVNQRAGSIRGGMGLRDEIHDAVRAISDPVNEGLTGL